MGWQERIFTSLANWSDSILAVACAPPISLPANLPALQASVISSKNGEIAKLEEKFQSAGGPCEEQAKDGLIILELKEGAAWSAVADLLDTEQLRIVDSGGFGTLTVASKAAPGDLAAQVAKLKASPLVQSADLVK